MSLRDVYWTVKPRARRERSLRADAVMDLLIGLLLISTAWLPLIILGAVPVLLVFGEYALHLWLKAHRPERPAEPRTKLDWHKRKLP